MIFFDLDHTLLDLESADRDALAKFRTMSPLGEKLAWEPFYAAWEAIRIDCFQRYLDGEFTYDGQRAERMRRIYREAGIELSEDEAFAEFMRYHAILRESWRLFPETWIALTLLGNRPLGLVTNGNARQQRDKLKKLEIEARFPFILTAEEAGCAKPDPQIFLMACERVGEKPEDCFYVGDHFASDIAPAEALGMKTVWVDRKRQSLPEGSRAVHVNNLISAACAVLDWE